VTERVERISTTQFRLVVMPGQHQKTPVVTPVPPVTPVEEWEDLLKMELRKLSRGELSTTFGLSLSLPAGTESSPY
jgi:hypothetical protein